MGICINVMAKTTRAWCWIDGKAGLGEKYISLELDSSYGKLFGPTIYPWRTLTIGVHEPTLLLSTYKQ